MKIRLAIQKSKVLEEVAQTTEYTAAHKAEDDGKAYDRVRMVDEDNSAVERFWDECRAGVVDTLGRKLEAEGMYSTKDGETVSDSGDYYVVTLNVSELFSTALVGGMEKALFSYFVLYITAKWYLYTNKEDAETYAGQATAMLETVKRDAYNKQAPVRPYHNNR